MLKCCDTIKCVGIKFMKQITVKFRRVVNFGVKGRDSEWVGGLTRVLCASKFYVPTSVLVVQVSA